MNEKKISDGGIGDFNWCTRRGSNSQPSDP